MKLHRRSVVTGMASLTVLGGMPLALQDFAFGYSGKPKVRHDARSADGKAMLKIYAKAVANMRKPDVAGTPADWDFQWYTHAVKGSTNKQAELDRIYPDSNDPNRLLASLMWDTCEAHFSGMAGANFLPWHRAYLLIFEEIVRHASGDEDFTLPYWDYATNAVLPDEFRMKDDTQFGPLFVDRRYSDVNMGVAIDQRQGVSRPELLNLDSLKEEEYLPGSGGIPPGFNRKLDGELHGFVHVNVGTPANMGSIPNAAYDPLFWIHHCNIDRIWAGWNANGGMNPSDGGWVNAKHVFADADGNRKEITNGEVTATEPIGYTYDKLPEKPSERVIVVAENGTQETAESVAAAPTGTLAGTDGEIKLGGETMSVRLTPSASTESAELTSRSFNPARKRYLVVSGIETNVQPGIVYDLIAKGPSAAESTPTNELYIGSIHFWDSQVLNGRKPPDRPFVFDVTEKLAGKADTDPLNYFIVPAGTPESDAQPVIGSIRLIEK